MSEAIHHLTTSDDWAARSADRYEPSAFADEGFIHLCTAQQLAGVVDRYYRDRTDLMLLTVIVDDLEDLVWEDTTGRGEDFPHLYGPLPLEAVRSAEPFDATVSQTSEQ